MWAADITYLPMAPWVPLPGGGDGLAQPVHGGLAAVQHPPIGVGGRLWKPGFCAEALEEALGKGRPEVFNTDQRLPLRRQGVASSPAWSSPRSSRTAA